jgi:hypothetical protein
MPADFVARQWVPDALLVFYTCPSGAIMEVAYLDSCRYDSSPMLLWH